ncbi:GntR family transcriptional regulator [Ornithinimicrobium sufpigmenti]|uniref:GntR family transcriptional regulator n=1 Tax=Ornithinimicrobium sufpigmenti TaxID=2508882 RepID=UPI0015E182AE|nr:MULTISPECIES: GntR family transcriptional regulator [unclassified Ornithinimicrobium]
MPRSAKVEVPPVAVSAEELLLRLVDTEAMPLYLQVVHQVKQRIMTGELADGVQLPAVRALAAHLGINPGTVVQAYRQLASEGLIESLRGRGSVVRPLSGRVSDTMARERLLDSAIDRLVARSRALGIPENQTLQRVSAALLDARTGVPVLFLGQTAEQATRFVGDLQRRYESHKATFQPLSMEELRTKGTESMERALEVSYTILTFATLVPELERLLDQRGVEAEIIGVRAELTQASLGRLGELSTQGRCAVVTESHAISTVLAEVERLAGIDRHDVQVVHRLPEGGLAVDELRPTLDSGCTLVYTSGVRAEVAALGLPPERLAELSFRLTPATLRKLDRRWRTAKGEEA